MKDLFWIAALLLVVGGLTILPSADGRGGLFILIYGGIFIVILIIIALLFSFVKKSKIHKGDLHGGKLKESKD